MENTSIAVKGGELESPSALDVGNASSTCTHSRLITGIDSCYCPDCKKTWSQWHSECKSLFTRASIEHQVEPASLHDYDCAQNPEAASTLEVGDKVCLRNQHIVGEIIAIEGDCAKVCFFEGYEPRSFLLSELVLRSTIIPQPANEEEDPVEAALVAREAMGSIPAPGFDYSALDAQTRTIVQQRANEIKNEIRRTTQSSLDIGEKLAEVQELLRHDKKGGFRGWLKSEFGWSKRTAYNFIQVWEKFGNCANFAQLKIASSALYLLAAPSTPEAARARALALAEEGVQITHKLAAYLIAEYKPKKQPKKSPTGKEASEKDAKTFLTSGDWVELLNPSPESGWSAGDAAEVQDLDRQLKTVLLRVDEHLLGKKQRTFSFDDIRKIDMSKPQRAKLPKPEPETLAIPILDLSSLISLKNEELQATLKALQQNIKAVKIEITRRHQSNH